MLQLDPKVGCGIIVVILIVMFAFSGASGEDIDPTMHMSDPDFLDQEWTMVLLEKTEQAGRFFTAWMNEDKNKVELECEKSTFDNFSKGLVYQKKKGEFPKPLANSPITEGNTDYGYYSGSTWNWHNPHYRVFVGYPLFSFSWHPHRYRSYWHFRRPWHSHFGARWSYRTHHHGWGGYSRRWRSGGFRSGGFRSGGFRSGGSSFRSSGGGFSSRGGK